MTPLSTQRKAKGVTVFFSVCFFLFLCMVVKEFKMFPWARKTFCFSEWKQLLGNNEGSVIDTSWSLVDLLQDLPTKPGHIKIQFISPNISGLRHVRYVFQFSLLIFCHSENYRFLAIFFWNTVASLYFSCGMIY